MDLLDAAVFFDTDPVLDGYDGSYLFDAQASSFNDSRSDGSTDRRRVLSVGGGITMPARRTISIYGELWLVGTATSDGFQGEVIRQHFNAKRVTNLLNLLTPAQALSAAAGTQAYAQKVYFKDSVNPTTDSEYDVQWNIFVAPAEPAGKGTFLRDEGGLLYRVRNSYIPTEGLRILQADELDANAIQSCVFNTGTRNPITEVVTAGTSTVTCIKVEVPKFYRFRHVADSNVQAGDVALFVPASVTLKQGMTFTMLGATWKVVHFQPEIDAQAALVRRA